MEEADGGGRWGKEMVEVDGRAGEDVVRGGRKGSEVVGRP